MLNLQYLFDKDRLLLTPAIDEYIFSKDTRNLYYGDGFTPGGRSILKDELASLFMNAAGPNLAFVYDTETQTLTNTLTRSFIGSIEEDKTPALGGNLNLNSFDITGAGNINILGFIKNDYVALDKNDIHSYDRGINIHSNHSIPVNIICRNPSGTLDDAPTLSLSSSVGTGELPSNTAPGGVLGIISASGYYNGEYYAACGLEFSWDKEAQLGSRASGAVITLAAGNNNNAASKATFSGISGVFSAPVLQTGVHAKENYPTAPSKGMIIFDDVTNHFYGYNGSEWKQLDN